MINGYLTNMFKAPMFGASFNCVNSYSWYLYQLMYRSDVLNPKWSEIGNERRLTLSEIEEIKWEMDTADMSEDNKQKVKYYDYSYMFNDYDEAVNYKIVLSSRNLGKTHGLNVELQKRDRTFMLMRRKQGEITNDAMNAFGVKYGTAINGRPWIYKNKMFYLPSEDDVKSLGKPLGYVNRLTNADAGSHLNFDYPHVTDIIIDEVFAFSTVENEWSKLQRWIGTLNRSTGRPVNNITVWLLGNPFYGYAPILRHLGFNILPKGKQKHIRVIEGVKSSITYELSDLISPTGTTNYQPTNIREITPQMIAYATPLFDVNVDGNKYRIMQTDSQIYVIHTTEKIKTEPLQVEHIKTLRMLYISVSDVKNPIIYNKVEALQLNEYLPFVK